MTPAEAEAIVMALPPETREAIAVFVEEAEKRFEDYDDVPPCHIAEEIRDANPYRYEPPLPVCGCKTKWQHDRDEEWRKSCAEARKHAKSYAVTKEDIMRDGFTWTLPESTMNLVAADGRGLVFK